MAKQDGQSNLNALKAQEARTEQLVKKHEAILDLYIKQGKEQEQINKRAKTLENAYVKLSVVQGKILKDEQAISQEDAKQEKSLTKQLISAGSILSVTEKMKSAVTFISKTQRDTANTMAVTLNQAKKVNKEIAKELKFGLIVDTTREEILESMNEMDDLFRTSNGYSANQAKTLSITANKLNISRGEAAKLSGLMQLIDGSSSETANATLALGKNLADASGVKFGKVMKDIASSGKDFSNATGMSLKNMIRTAIETRKMGFELNDALGLANSLLDVESSIESQMKFNVLTGKQANFDRARALVLENDMSGALDEVRKQVGDISNLNILEIQSLQQATGLRADQLQIANSIADNAANNLNNTEAANQAYEDGNVLLADQLLSKEHATTAAEMMEKAESNIKESLASQLTDQNKLKTVMIGIQSVQAALAAIATVKAIADVTSMSALTVGVGALAIAAGIATAVGSMTNAFSSAKPPSMDDGVIGPDGGMLVSGPKGSIQLNKDDSIIAGTNLGGGSSVIADKLDTLISKNSLSSDAGMSTISDKLDKMIYLLSQQRVLNVSGTQLGEVMDLERVPVGMG